MSSRKIAILRGQALREQSYRCFYCKSPLKPLDATADHMHPTSERGRTTGMNIVASCRACNEAKGNLFAEQFFKKIKKSKPPSDPALMLIWASRKIWKRAHRACERIEQLVI